MSEQTYSVIRKQIVKAKNMTHARMVSEGYENFPGEVLHDDCEIIETEIKEVWNEEEQDAQIFLDSHEATAADQSIFLRSENRRLARIAEKNKNVKDETVYAVYQAAFDAFSSIETAPIKGPTLKVLPGVPEMLRTRKTRAYLPFNRCCQSFGDAMSCNSKYMRGC